MSEDHHPKFGTLIGFLSRIPAVETNDTPSRGFGSGSEERAWWVKFSIDIDHDLAWHAVQELGCVLNYLSVGERLPTVFKPVSPAPYLNGGPEEFLSWVIECPDSMPPGTVAKWLEERLPKPVEDEAAWLGESDDNDAGDDDDADDEDEADD